ncbi:MAG: hypothetical protein RL377_651 [Bacteroidota bacterium]
MKQLVALLSLVIISGTVSAQNSQEHKKSVEEWHQKRIDNLKEEDGWLNLEGLFWLHQGVNTFGSDARSDCYYNNPNFPTYLGDFILKGDSVVWVNQIEKGALVNKTAYSKGKTVTVFKWDGTNEQAAVFNFNRFKWVVIKREDKIGIRFRNLDATTLTGFKGIERFTVDAKWKIKAVLEKPQENFLMITNVLGQTTAQKKAGTLKFEVEGKPYSLDVIDEGGVRYFITFADATSGKTTYGAGRFIEVTKADADGITVIDFNLAYNPPCAFTAFATCPLPPAQNRLSIAITAGEKNYGHH